MSSTARVLHNFGLINPAYIVTVSSLLTHQPGEHAPIRFGRIFYVHGCSKWAWYTRHIPFAFGERLVET